MKLSSVSGLSLLLFFVVSGIFSSLATAQESPRLPAAFTHLFTQEMERQMRYAPEQIHLFTDREVYAAGDTIWFSGWVLNDQTLEPTTHSRRLYVDLISPELKVVQDLVLELTSGTTHGSFVLSENQLSDAFFQLRAYTQWSSHFDSTYSYHRILPVWQKAPSDTTNQQDANYQMIQIGDQNRYEFRRIRSKKEGVEAVADDGTSESDSLPIFDVAFLPEGGSWVEGIPCRMAFKALAPDGYGVEVEGDILDQNDSVIFSFRSEHLGMGSFLITPQPGKSYTARLFTGQRVELPKPLKSGVSLTTEFKQGLKKDGSADTLTATITLSHEEVDPAQVLYLVVQSPGMPSITYAPKRVRSSIPVKISATELPGGITRLTLYNEKAEPLAERLCFLPLKQQRLSVEVEPSIALVDTPADLSGARLALKLQSKPLQTGTSLPSLMTESVADTLNTPSTFSKKHTEAPYMLVVSVTDSLYAPSNPSSASLVSRMLLQGFLKGEVEEAHYYFSHPYDSVASALNLVMLTHGWRGFLQKPRPGESVLETFKASEEGFGISGRISDIFNSPLSKRKISLLVQGDLCFAKDTRTNENGWFAFPDLPLRGSSKLTLFCHNMNNKLRRINVGFELDPQADLEKPPVYAPRLPQQSIGVISLLENFRQQKIREQNFLDSLKKVPGMYYIEEVAVTAKPYIKNSYNKNGPGKADLVLDEKAMEKFDRFSNLLEVLEHEVPGFRKGYISPDQEHFSEVPKDDYIPQFVIGVRPVNFLFDGGPFPLYTGDRFAPELARENSQSESRNRAVIAKPTMSPQGLEDYFEFRAALLRNLSVSQLAGVEVMVTPDNVSRYGVTGVNGNSSTAPFLPERFGFGWRVTRPQALWARTKYICLWAGRREPGKIWPSGIDFTGIACPVFGSLCETC
ncbi:MAG: hypothetical protein AB7C90_01040 [Bacteroidales bacterium]